MNTEDTENVTTPFIVVYFSQGGSLPVSPGRHVYITYCTFYMTYLYYIGTGVLYHAPQISKVLMN